MFYFLSKTFGLLVRPLSWLIILMFMAVFCRKPKLKKISLVASLVILLVFTNPFILNIALKMWEPTPVAIETLPTYDVGIVLGGFAHHSPITNNMALNDCGDRLWQTIFLYRHGKIKQILISGGGTKNGKSEAETVYDALVAMGIPDSVLLAETKSRNTYENATFSAELIAENHPEGATCVVVTSALHIKRALGCFRKAGLNLDVFPAEHLVRSNKTNWIEWLRPESSTLQNWERLINEWVGITVYRIKGYI
jgi:uncharacterized SAM-binding protein YcdF (DUF218 family)